MVDERIGVELSDFPVGDVNPVAQYFTGETYFCMMTTEQVPTANVTFAPSCRNNWHVHHASEGGGQMLIVVYGHGWYQEEGGPARELHAGDVVNIPANVKHWHGAAAGSWFQHVALEIEGTDAWNEWLEPVTDEEYAKLGQ